MHAVRNTAEQITASGELPALCSQPHDSPSATLSKCSGRQRQNTQVYVSERACGGIASWMGERLDPHPGSSGACICKWIGPDLLDPSQGWLVRCLCHRQCSWHVARVISSLCSFSCSYEPRITNKNNLGSAVSPEMPHLVVWFFILCFSPAGQGLCLWALYPAHGLFWSQHLPLNLIEDFACLVILRIQN